MKIIRNLNEDYPKHFKINTSINFDNTQDLSEDILLNIKNDILKEYGLIRFLI